MLTCRYVNSFICPHVNRTVASIIFMLGLCALTLFLCTQDFKARKLNRFFVRACARLYARKTCFQRFGPNSLNFYRIKLIFKVFWDAEKNLKRWAGLFSSAMATFSVAGVFTIRRYTVYMANIAKCTTACAGTVSIR